MSVIAHERSAIEAILERVDPREFQRLKSQLTGGLLVPGSGLYRLRDVPIRFAGVSKGGGVGSRSDKNVGVFVERPEATGIYQPPGEEIRSCDLLVIIRVPTPREREESLLKHSVLWIVEAIGLWVGNLEGVRSLEVTEPFVVC